MAEEKRREELLQDYDNALLALVMDEYAHDLGKQALQEHEDTKVNPSDAACQEERLDSFFNQLLQDSKRSSSGKLRAKRILKRASLVAAIIAIVFAVLVVAQAAGLDVFGALAKWTAGTFSFGSGTTVVSTETETVSSGLDEVAAYLEQLCIPTQLVPSRLPDGYTLAEIRSLGSKRAHGIYAIFSNETKNSVSIIVSTADEENQIDNLFVEKNSGDPKVYPVGNKQFFLMENEERWVATWSDGEYYIYLGGFQSKDELLLTLNSY